jgi:hypothetical protein
MWCNKLNICIGALLIEHCLGSVIQNKEFNDWQVKHFYVRPIDLKRFVANILSFLKNKI